MNFFPIIQNSKQHFYTKTLMAQSVLWCFICSICIISNLLIFNCCKNTPHIYMIYHALNSVLSLSHLLETRADTIGTNFKIWPFDNVTKIAISKTSYAILLLNLYLKSPESHLYEVKFKLKTHWGGFGSSLAGLPVIQPGTWAIRSQPWDTKSRWMRELWLVWQKGLGEMEGEAEERQW